MAGSPLKKKKNLEEKKDVDIDTSTTATTTAQNAKRISKYAKVRHWKKSKKKNKKKRDSRDHTQHTHQQQHSDDEHDDDDSSNSSNYSQNSPLAIPAAKHHEQQQQRRNESVPPKRKITRTHSKRGILVSSSDPNPRQFIPHPTSAISASAPPLGHRPQLNRAPSVKKHRQRGCGVFKILKKKLHHSETGKRSSPLTQQGQIDDVFKMTDEEIHQLCHHHHYHNEKNTHHTSKTDDMKICSLPPQLQAQPTAATAQPIYNEYYPYTTSNIENTIPKKTENGGISNNFQNAMPLSNQHHTTPFSASAPPTTTIRYNKHHQKRRTGTVVQQSITGTPGWATRQSVIPTIYNNNSSSITSSGHKNGRHHSSFLPKKLAVETNGNGYQKTIVEKNQSNQVSPPRTTIIGTQILQKQTSQSSILSYASDKISIYTPTKKVGFSFQDDVVHHHDKDDNNDEKEEEEDYEKEDAYLAHLCCNIPETSRLRGLKQSTLLWKSVKDVCPPASNIELDPRWQIFDIFRSLRKSDAKNNNDDDALYTSFYESFSTLSPNDLSVSDGSRGGIAQIHVASERSVENGIIERFAMQFSDSENLLPPERKRDVSLELETFLSRGSNGSNLSSLTTAASSLKRGRKQIGRGPLVANSMDSFAHEDDGIDDVNDGLMVMEEEEDWEGEHWQKLEALAKSSSSSRNLLPNSKSNSIENNHGSLPVKKDLASFFTVWRPTSEDAINKLMDGIAVGKALNVKGKSAKCGRLSGYVPFIQIHADGDISKCCTPCRDSNVRIYFKSMQARVIAVKELEMILDEMLHKCAWAQEVIQAEEDGWETVDEEEDESDEEVVEEMDENESLQHPYLGYMRNQFWRQQPGNPRTMGLPLSLMKETGAEIDLEMSTKTGFFSANSTEEEEFEDGKEEVTEITAFYSDHKEEGSDLAGEGGKVPFSSALSSPPLHQPTIDNRVVSVGPEEGEIEEALSTIAKWDMVEPQIVLLDHCRDSYGVEVPERLLWETYVRRGNIQREAGSDLETGRPSEPAFMDLNIHALREQKEGTPRAVIWQEDGDCPLDPRTLLVAYEEEDRVKPVASDFDAFLIGTKGVNFAPLDNDQMDVLQWQVQQIKRLLDAGPSIKGWTSRWFEILKEESDKGFHPEPPPYGYGDRVSYSIVDKAVWKLRNTGAVRHGPESFNFYAPQEIDSHFLVVSDHFGSVPWMYLSANDLREFLALRIEEGFVFPMNVKWALCDQGWYDIWKSLLKSKDCQQAMNSWFPPESGLREQIQAIHEAHPEGFVRLKEPAIPGLGVISENEEDLDPDIAALQLKRHITLRRVKRKLRAILLLMGKI